MIGQSISHYEILEKLRQTAQETAVKKDGGQVGEGEMGVNKIKRRKTLRLKDYDYSEAGAYFVTMCTCDHQNMFGEIVDAEMQMNDRGRVVESYWNELPAHYPEIELDAFVVMPNHIHGIIIIVDDDHTIARVGARLPRPYNDGSKKKPTLGNIVAYFKYQSTKRMNESRGAPGVRVWQRNYYEHIIRSEKSLHGIQGYIDTNPARWQYDKENSTRSASDGSVS